jgi:hypothetical protein
VKFFIKQWYGLENIELITDYLNIHVYYSVFQSPGFYNFYRNQKNAIPFLFTVWDDGKLTGSLLAVRFSHRKGYPGFLADRTIVWGGPLLYGEKLQRQKSLEMLLEALVQECSGKSAFIEFRNMFDLSEYADIFSDKGFLFSDQMNCIVQSDDREKTESNIRGSKLRQIRKGLERGATITEVQHITQLKQYYRILKDLYSGKVKKPLPDYSFFESFYSWGKESGMGVILVVLFEGKVIGGSLCPVSPQKEIFEWYTGALTKEYKLLYPGVLATWAPVDYALKHNIPLYNLMGIGKPGIPYGVRNFKVQFGGEVVNFGRYTRINNPKLFRLTKAGYRLLGFRE